MTAPQNPLKAQSPFNTWRPLNQRAHVWGGDREIVLHDEATAKPQGRLVRLSSYSAVPQTPQHHISLA